MLNWKIIRLYGNMYIEWNINMFKLIKKIYSIVFEKLLNVFVVVLYFIIFLFNM